MQEVWVVSITLLVLTAIVYYHVLGKRRTSRSHCPTQQSTAHPIPRRIFQTWKSRHIQRADFLRWQKTWKEKHPGYSYTLWDDEDNYAFMSHHYPWFMKRYDSYNHNIKRADAVRYFYLFHYGGIYVDLDFEALTSHEHLLQQYDRESSVGVILGRLPDDKSRGSSWYMENLIPNAIMVSKPRAAFWVCVFYHLLHAPHRIAAESETGPVLLRHALEDWRRRGPQADYFVEMSSLVHPVMAYNEVSILHPNTWYFNGWDKPDMSSIPAETLAVTHWTGTWK